MLHAPGIAGIVVAYLTPSLCLAAVRGIGHFGCGWCALAIPLAVAAAALLGNMYLK